jgi:multiple sugar transport system substrate-binding protein
MSKNKLSRRDFLLLSGGATVGTLLAACQPQVIKETVEVEVTREVEVEKSVEVPVEVVQEVTPTPGPKVILWMEKYYLEAYNQVMQDTALLVGATNNFEVEVQFQPQAELTTKTLAAAEADTLPDVEIGITLPLFQAMGILRDVSGLVQDLNQVAGGFFDSGLKLVTVGGKQYGVPFINQPQPMYYRRDLFSEAGFDVPIDTMSEFQEATLAVTNPAQKIWGFGNPISRQHDTGVCFMTFVYAFGGTLQDEEGNVTINSPETLEALTFYTDLLTKHGIMPPGVTGWDNAGNNKAYLTGQLAACYNTGSIVNAMREDDPGWLEDTALGPMPAGPNGRKAVMDFPHSIGIFDSTAHPEYAELLVKGLLEPDRYMASQRAAGGTNFPVLKDLVNDPFYAEDPWNSQIAQTVQYVVSKYEGGDPASWMDEVFSQFLWEEMAIHVAVDEWDPQEALDEFERQAIEIKKKHEEQA